MSGRVKIYLTILFVSIMAVFAFIFIDSNSSSDNVNSDTINNIPEIWDIVFCESSKQGVALYETGSIANFDSQGVIDPDTIVKPVDSNQERYSLMLSRDCRFVYYSFTIYSVSGVKSTVIKYDINDRKIVWTANDLKEQVWVMAESPDQRRIYIGGNRNDIGIHDAENGKELETLELDAWVSSVTHPQFTNKLYVGKLGKSASLVIAEHDKLDSYREIRIGHPSNKYMLCDNEFKVLVVGDQVLSVTDAGGDQFVKHDYSEHIPDDYDIRSFVKRGKFLYLACTPKNKLIKGNSVILTVDATNYNLLGSTQTDYRIKTVVAAGDDLLVLPYSSTEIYKLKVVLTGQ